MEETMRQLLIANQNQQTYNQNQDAKNQKIFDQIGILAKALTERPQGALSSDIALNLKGEIKAITTQSGIVLDRPPTPTPTAFSPKEVKRDPKPIMYPVLTESNTRVPYLVVQSPPISTSFKIHSPPNYSSFELPERNPHQPLIPYPSRLNKDKLQDKFNIQIHKFLQMFKKLHFSINLAEAIALMSNGPPKNVTKKLRDPRIFLIPCDFYGLELCMDLANLGASINLMLLFVWKKLSLPNLTPTRMTLELATRLIAYPSGIAEDVYVQVGKFTFPAYFIVIEYDIDPHVPLILGRPFLRMARALVDVYEEKLILRDGNEKLIFHADSTLKHPPKHGNESINMINFTDITCEDCFPEVLKIKKSNHPLGGSTAPLSDSFPSLTPFKTSDSLLEKFTNELTLLDPFPPGNEDDNFDLDADLRKIKYLLN
nr:hypothetical protein [Tanacetum cinerariifolium]